MTPIEAEGEWLAGLPDDRKVLFLAFLSQSLTIAGRNSYLPLTEDLENPPQLRQINEVQHRVTACLCQLLTGCCELSFQISIASWVLEQRDAELEGLMGWAWRSTKQRVTAIC